MMIKKLCVAVLLILFCSEGIYSVAYAGNAETLPKGRSRFNTNYTYYLPFEHRYSGNGGKRGDIEDVATDFNAVVDNTIFPNLIPAGQNLGETIVDFEFQYSILDLSYQYGITDKLTAGIRVPYIWSTNKVKSFLDPTNATLGTTVTGANFFATPIAPFGTFGDEVPVTTNDLKNILSGGLDVTGSTPGIDVPGLGYRWFKSWADEYFGDIEAGFRYQYLKTKDWRLAANFGARIPTGPIDDPDNLVDFHFFTFGAYGLLFRLNNDYTGIKNHVFNTTFRYDLILQKEVELRITSDVNVPITPNKERVRRKIGDIVQVEVSDKYTPFKGFNISALYNFTFKYKNDRVSGDRGFAYESAERETAFKSHNIIIGLAYSTIPLYIEKKFPVPMSVDLAYRYKFAGRNNSMKSQYIKFGLNFYF